MRGGGGSGRCERIQEQLDYQEGQPADGANRVCAGIVEEPIKGPDKSKIGGEKGKVVPYVWKEWLFLLVRVSQRRRKKE